MFKIPAIEDKIKKQKEVKTPKKKERFSYTKINDMATEWSNFEKAWGVPAGTYTGYVSAREGGKTRLFQKAWDALTKGE